jgi:hypothetical protein
LQAAVEAVAGFVSANRAAATRRRDWGEFEAWCGRGAAITLPAASATVAAYLACMATWRSPARVPTAAPISETAAAPD